MKATWTGCLKTVKTGLAKSLFLITALVGASNASVAGAAFAKELTDALGTQVKVADHPVRVVTLAPSLAELASDLLGESLERIVGVSDYTDYPPALGKVKSVGSYARFNLEAVVALKPDLVLATSDGNSRDQIDHLRELHLPVVVVKTSSFSEIDQSIEILAKALDEQNAGDALRKQLKVGLQHIEAHAEARREGKAEPTVLLELDSNPLVVAGSGTFLDEALRKVGAKNIYSNANKPYPKPSVEDVVKRNPDVILLLAMDRNLKTFGQAAKDWKRFSKMKAVQSGKIKVIRADEVIRPSLRILEGLSLLEQAIYGK
jgi:iron complex transport system substrate-binding protein